MSKTGNHFWELQQKSIPFDNELPKEYQVHDKLITCPKCDGELFGRCLCCQLYFCHGACKNSDDYDATFTEDDIMQMLAEKGVRT